MNYTVIDMDAWPRRERYEHYMRAVPCTYSMTVKLDITSLRRRGLRIYPAMLHQTPQVFGKKISQAMMGVQMACAYVGTTVVSPVFGLLAEALDVRLLPLYLLVFLALMILGTERVCSYKKAGKAA